MNMESNVVPAAGGASGREGAPSATDLTGQVAVVTGASRGIGQAIAMRLGRLGASVVVNYSHDSSGAAQTVAAIKAAGSRATDIRADVSKPAEIKALLETARRRPGQRADAHPSRPAPSETPSRSSVSRSRIPDGPSSETTRLGPEYRSNRR